MSTKGKVMVIDDEQDFLKNIARIINHWEYECIPVQDSLKVQESLRRVKPDVVFTDLKMPRYDGFAVLKAVAEWDQDIPVIMVTGYGTVLSAVQAMKGGAYDYITKPFDLEELQLILQRAMERRLLLQENQNLHAQLMEVYGERNIVVASRQMHACLKLAKKVANTEATVLITGESGTGKELLARFIHNYSGRAKKPFIPFDCTTLPENLMETELFGYQKGAFSGAVCTKPGLIEAASGGTLLFDEVGELPLSLQAKLLRFLQERQYRRVGGNEFFNTDVRILAATNRSLESEVEAGRFRADLFYRLNVFPIKIPPLRERPEDILILSKSFMQKFVEENNKALKGFSPEAKQRLELYQWPGNVRELRNIVERAVLLAEGDFILSSDLPALAKDDLQHKDLEMTKSFKELKERQIEILEQEYFSQLLLKHMGNITKVAEEAGVNRRTIHRLINKYDLKYV